MTDDELIERVVEKAIYDLGMHDGKASKLVSELLMREEFDILHHLYDYGPIGVHLVKLYEDCFEDFDLFMIDLRVRMEQCGRN